MKKIFSILVSTLVAMVFVSCNENVPSNNQELTYKDSLVLELQTKLIGDSLTIWQDYAPNTVTFSQNLKFKKDTIMILNIGWIGYNDGIYYGEEDELPVKSIEYKKYEIRFDETGWNAFIKIGEDINSIKYNEYYNDNSSINIGNTNYYKTTSQYPTITKYVKDFIE